MLVDLRKIRRSGLDSEEFSFDYEMKNDVLDIPQAKIENPVKVEGSATLTGTHSIYIEFDATFTVTGECMRCLEPVKKTFTASFGDDLDDQSADETGYSVVNDTVILDKIVEDAVILEMPKTLLCKEDCLGICPECGANLNYIDCKCKK